MWDAIKKAIAPLILPIFAALIAGVIVNTMNGYTIKDLRKQLEAANSEVRLFKAIREADAQAVMQHEKSQKEANARAKEGRDVLDQITPDMSDADVVWHCINGVCVQKGYAIGSGDNAARPDGSMRDTGSAKSHDRGQNN